MGIVKWNPALVNRVFDDFFANQPAARRTFGGTMPAINIQENNDEFKLELAAPGLKKEDFKIKVENEVLSISVGNEKTKEEKNKPEGYTRREFFFNKFNRQFNLPETVDERKISAKYEDGILYVAIPKKEEAKPQPARLIEIG